HSYIALLDKSGATLKEAMQLARHSDPKLTMAVYGRAQLLDLGKAGGRLPALASGPATLAVTGTDGQADSTSFCPACESSEGGCGSLRAIDGRGQQEGGDENRPQIQQSEGLASGCDSLRLSEGSSPSRTRTYNKPVNRRILRLAECNPNPDAGNSLRKINPICKPVRTLSSGCEKPRQFRSRRVTCGSSAEDLRK